MKFSFLFSFTLITLLISAQDFIYHVEPPNWWINMSSNELQLMIHGDKVGEYELNIEHEQIKILRENRLSNPNYVILYLEILKSEKDFDFKITFSKEGKIYENYTYHLYKRDKTNIRSTFNSSDVIYLITPDRFANGDSNNDINKDLLEKKLIRNKPNARHGGDILGIINHLDYIAEMGFTAIWSTPMLENNMKKLSYHGYAITDLYKIDPRMGNNEMYKQLSLEANKLGIKLIKDVVLNHIGIHHWWMEDIPSKDWINNKGQFFPTSHRREVLHDPYGASIDYFNFNSGWFVEEMPDLNQKNPDLAKYLIQNSIWWIEFAELSGFRVDTYSYSDRKFLYQWNKAIQNEYPGFNIVGEEWTISKSIIGLWQKPNKKEDEEMKSSLIKQNHPSELPSLMDFPLQNAISQAFKPKKDPWNEPLTNIYKSLAEDYLYPNPSNMVIFLDNHDMRRVFLQLEHDYNHWKMAIAYLLTTRGIPQIYYGTEILMSDTLNPGDHGTLRADFPGGWEDDKVSAFTGFLKTEQIAAQDYIKNLLNWRKTCKAIHSGALKHFAPSNNTQSYITLRYNKKTTVMLVINKGVKKLKITPFDYMRESNYIKDNYSAANIVTGDELDIRKEISIEPKSLLLVELNH
tara:strand:- start:15584 stop:17476 length:1893 start_codon:yes stop_codon:yes gene_type:complete